MKTIIFINSEDWEVVYSNGIMFAEGHHIAPIEWFRLGQKHYNTNPENIAEYYFEDEKAEKINYNFPESIHDIPKELFEEVKIEDEDE